MFTYRVRLLTLPLSLYTCYWTHLKMDSAQILNFFIKTGVLPVANDRQGEARMDLCNKMFLFLNLFRILPLSGYLYFSLINLMDDFNLKTGVSFLFRSVGFVSGPVLTLVLSYTAQRHGVYTLTGTSKMCRINYLIPILYPIIYSIGIAVMEIPGGMHLNTFMEKICFSVSLIFVLLYLMVDYGILFVSCFLWVNDLRVRIAALLLKKNIMIEDCEEILFHYNSLRSAIELTVLALFSVTQFYSITAAYLGFSGKHWFLCYIIGTELKTLEWWISRLMLKLLVLLNSRLCKYLFSMSCQ